MTRRGIADLKRKSQIYLKDPESYLKRVLHLPPGDVVDGLFKRKIAVVMLLQVLQADSEPPRLSCSSLEDTLYTAHATFSPFCGLSHLLGL